jgi:hypothetical protein
MRPLAHVLLFCAVLFSGTFLFVTDAFAASLSLSPGQGTYVEGAVIPVDIIVESDEQSANAVSGTIVFTGASLTPVSVEVGDSIIDIWIEKPSINMSRSVISFEGLILNPGLTGTGKIARIYFKVTGEGSADIHFDSGSILANDGNGTNILDSFSGSKLSLRQKREGEDNQSAPDTDIIDLASRIRPPVVTQYSRNIAALDELFLQGITYPEAEVRVWLRQADEAPEQFAVESDQAGNFVYIYGRDKEQRFSLARSLSASALFPFLERRYYFWASVVQGENESAATQVFEVIVGGLGSIDSSSIVITAVAVAVIVGLLILTLIILIIVYGKRIFKKVERAETLT